MSVPDIMRMQKEFGSSKERSMKTMQCVQSSALGAAMAISCGAHAGFNGMQVTFHGTVDTALGPRDVYRVYANFTAGGDQLSGWGGTPSHPAMIQTRACTNVLGNNFFNPGGIGGNTAPYLADVEFNPDLEWGTFATIGVTFADQGSGSKTTPDTTTLSPLFPTFITGNQLNLSNGAVFVPGSDSAQARADYAGDGDPALRVLMMQLAVLPGDGVSVKVGTLNWLPEGSSFGQTVFDLNNDIAALSGRCCTPSGECFFTDIGACLSFGQNTWLGCEPCSSCEPQGECVADIAPPDGNGEVDIDDMFVVIGAWGPCGKGECVADITPEGGDGEVNIDDLTAVILGWGDCPSR
jgi:hypothetical protein